MDVEELDDVTVNQVNPIEKTCFFFFKKPSNSTVPKIPLGMLKERKKRQILEEMKQKREERRKRKNYLKSTRFKQSAIPAEVRIRGKKTKRKLNEESFRRLDIAEDSVMRGNNYIAKYSKSRNIDFLKVLHGSDRKKAQVINFNLPPRKPASPAMIKRKILPLENSFFEDDFEIVSRKARKMRKKFGMGRRASFEYAKAAVKNRNIVGCLTGRGRM